MRKSLDLTLDQLSELAKVDVSNLSKVERGLSGYSKESIDRIARALSVPLEVLFAEGSNVNPIPRGSRTIPVLDYVQAGEWTASRGGRPDPEIQEHILTDIRSSAETFALRINGDSMTPDFREGDCVLIDPSISPRPGDFVVAANGDEGALFKQYREREVDSSGKPVIELVPLNSAYPIYRGDVVPLRIIGTMLEHRRYRKR